MYVPSIHLIRILALTLIAIALGIVLLLLDHNRQVSAAGTSLSGVIGEPASVVQPMSRADGEHLVAGAAAAVPALGLSPHPASAAPSPSPASTTATVATRGGVACGAPHRVVEVDRAVSARATPGGREIGTLPSQSKYLGSSMQAWVQSVSADGAWGKVTIPWSPSVNRAAWVPLAGASQSATRILVVGDISDRTLRVYRGCTLQFAAPMAVGAPGSPSPVGRFWVTDRVAVPRSQPEFGSYAFGLSTIQPHPPAGWTGGNQMAIHGTNAPGSIGTPASAGCLRVSEQTLSKLRTMVGLGTPVVIQR
ncbi:MAG: L,D-transpeptidase [Gaiellales bacterium]